MYRRHRRDYQWSAAAAAVDVDHRAPRLRGPNARGLASSMSRDQFEPDVITNASACMANTSATSEW